MRVGIIAMGFGPMTLKLQASGYRVAYNRTPEKLKPLVAIASICLMSKKCSRCHELPSRHRRSNSSD